MPHIGFPELVVILVLALVVFGAGRLPEVGRSLGTAIRDFKDAFSGGGAAAGGTPPPRPRSRRRPRGTPR